jgi:hypothetical protein
MSGHAYGLSSLHPVMAEAVGVARHIKCQSACPFADRKKGVGWRKMRRLRLSHPLAYPKEGVACGVSQRRGFDCAQ